MYELFMIEDLEIKIEVRLEWQPNICLKTNKVKAS